jgi:hypothetical protein
MMPAFKGSSLHDAAVKFIASGAPSADFSNNGNGGANCDVCVAALYYLRTNLESTGRPGPFPANVESAKAELKLAVDDYQSHGLTCGMRQRAR